MSYYKGKPGYGSIFKNKNRESDKHPDFMGRYTHLDGSEYKVGAWIKEADKHGEPFIIFNIQKLYWNR
jgi:uncharacterized protein (DUF736 family)